MPTVVLQHCVPVEVFTSEVATDVTLDLSVGGVPGDGSIDVTASPNPVSPPGPLPAGSPGTFAAQGCTSLVLHFRRPIGHPSTVSVTYTLQTA